MLITNGGTLVSSPAAGASGIGLNGNSFAIVTVDGANSSWTHNSTLSLGTNTGIGILLLENGARVNALAGNFGIGGQLRVDGGARLTFSGPLTTAAELVIIDGGAMSSTTMTMLNGFNVLVDGAGSNLTTSGSLLVGGTGSSTLTIQNGGTVSSGSGYLTFGGPSNAANVGNVAVDGNGSAWNTGVLVVGGINRGNLSIVNGGRVTSTSGEVGYNSGTGTVTVDGVGSTLAVNGDLAVGDSGTGTLNVRNGGLISANNLILGRGSPVPTVINVGNGSAAGTLSVSTIQALGQATINFDQADASVLAAPISGSLNLNKRGAGTLQLNGVSTYTGPTAVEGGTLRTGAASVLSPNSAYTVSSGAMLDLAGFSQIVPSLANSGTVSTVGSVPGATLTVTGAYVGNDGVLRLGTALGDNGSATDRLVLDGAGASASGSTTVQITNLGGLGAPTTGNGIEVIAARNGATTTAQTTQSAFTLATGNGVAVPKGTPVLQASGLAGGHVDVGAFEYRLYAADANGAGESWYLRTTVTPVVPPTGGGTTGGGTTGSAIAGGATTGVAPADTTALGSVGTSTGAPVLSAVTAYRSEVPLYASVAGQLRQGGLAMLSNRHQRIGDDEPTVAGAGPSALGERRAWGRLISTDLDIRQSGTVNPASDGRLSGFQAGTDLFANRQWRAGVYVGQLDGDAAVNGFASGIANQAVGSTDLKSRYFGAYGTYTADSGWYADAVLQHGRHTYRASPNLGLSTSAKGTSTLVSLEAGKAFDLGTQWKIEPSVQIAHQRMNLDDSTIPGAVVQLDTHSGWTARAGVRVKGQFATGVGTLQPYARLNFYRSSGGNDVARFVGPAGSTDIASAAGGSSTELAAGMTLALGERTSVYAEAGKLWASGGDARVKSGVQGSVGLRVKW
ncbi:MAG: autotransporter outer membrane beta-barrel domain-containing protein [Gammaproteobacteria bacterium]|nr:autotransporter outer membrane beta-barrel domain-containing protein [Gammaproteobacteria bacterium]